MLDVPWLDKPAGQLCQHASTAGCGLWPNPPAMCKAFACMYRKEAQCSPKLKPDSCGVMFEQIDPKIVLGTTRKLITKSMMGQVKAFNRVGISVVLSQPGELKKAVYPATDADQLVVTRRVEQIILEARDGSA